MPRFISVAQNSSLVYQYIQLLTYHLDSLKISQIYDVHDQIRGLSLQTMSSCTLPSHSKWHHHLFTSSGHSLLYPSLLLSNLSPRPTVFVISVSVESVFLFIVTFTLFLAMIISYEILLNMSLYIHFVLPPICSSTEVRVNDHFKTHTESHHPA